MLDVKIEGVESLQHDLDEFNTKVNKGINYGLKAVASELTPCLQRHIQTDVYDAYVGDYERRYDHPQYGRSIFSQNNMDYHFLVGGRGVEFTYEPQGRNTRYPSAPYYTNGDSIIDVIQQDKGYLWVDSIGTKRPFWDNFVKDVIHSGDQWFVRGFNEHDSQVQATPSGNLIGEASDYNLSPTYTHTQDRQQTSTSNNDDDDLPY